MKKTLFVKRGIRYGALCCAWVATGNSRQPLACIWIDREMRAFGGPMAETLTENISTGDGSVEEWLCCA